MTEPTLEPVTPTPPEDGMTRKGCAAAGGFALLIVVGITGAVVTEECGGGEGSLQITGSPAGDFTVAGDAECDSQWPHFAVMIAGTGEGGLILTDQPAGGATVELVLPGNCRGRSCPVVTVPAEACETFDADLEEAGYEMNRRPAIDGHAQLRCTLDDGTRIEGQLQISGCY